MQSFRVVSTSIQNGFLHVVKEIVEDSGDVTLNLHVMPIDSVAWYMAETGLDVDEAFEELLCTVHNVKRDKIKERQGDAKALMRRNGVHEDYVKGADNDHKQFVRDITNSHADNIKEKRKQLAELKRQGRI